MTPPKKVIITNKFKKYFRSKEGLQALHAAFPSATIRHILRETKCGEKVDTVSVKTDNKKFLKYFQTDKENCIHAFASNCWNHLKDDERIRTIYTFVNEYMSDFYNDKNLPSIHLLREPDQEGLKADACYCYKRGKYPSNYLYINTDNFDSSSGLHLSNVIAHELQHWNDFEHCRTSLIPKFQENYLQAKTPQEQDLEIMFLPLEGTIFNQISQQEEIITPELREQILLLKHYINPIKTESKKGRLDSVFDRRNLRDLMEYISYMYTPAERRAHERGREIAYDIATKNIEYHIPLSYNDSITLTHLNNVLANADKGIADLENLTGQPMYRICDLFYRKQYLDTIDINTPKLKAMKEETIVALRTLVDRSYAKLKEQRLSSEMDNDSLEGM